MQGRGEQGIKKFFKERIMEYDLILHLDSAEESLLRMCLRNAGNYYKALPDEHFELVLVANGGGVKHFARDTPELKNWAAELADRGMKIKVCANAMAEHGIKAEDLWPFCEVVPAGLVAIIDLQNLGYSYVKP